MANDPSARFLREMKRPGHVPLWYVEVDLDRCSLTYATAPCGVNAGLGGTGDLGDGNRCHYTYKTCQARNTFARATHTYRFISYDAPRPPKVAAQFFNLAPFLVDVEPISQEIDVAKGFTRTEHMRVRLNDMEGNVYFNTDKTIYNTTRQGSYLRRFIAMNPNFRGRSERRMRVYRGFYCEDWEYTDFWQVWVGTVENVQYGKACDCVIEAVDLFTGVDRELPKVQSASNVVLNTVIGRFTTGPLTLEVPDATQYTDPATILKSKVVVRVGKKQDANDIADEGLKSERMIVTAVDTVSNPNTLTVTRAQYGDPAITHFAGEPVTEILAFSQPNGQSGMMPVDICLALLERVDIKDTDLDLVQIAREAEWIGPVQMRRFIDEPKRVRDLMFEIVGDHFEGNFLVDEDLKIRLRINRPLDLAETSQLVNDNPNVIYDETVVANRNERLRLTDVIVYYGPVDGEDSEYEDRVIVVNADTVISNYYGSTPETTKTIKSKWLINNNLGGAIIVGSHWAHHYRTPPWRFEWVGGLRDGQWRVGSYVTINTVDIQDSLGELIPLEARVVKKRWLKTDLYEFAAQAHGTMVEPDEEDVHRCRYGFVCDNGISATYDGQADPLASRYVYMADALLTLGVNNHPNFCMW